MRLEIQSVCRNKLILNSVPLAFHSQAVARTVKMSVEAPSDFIALQQLQDLVAGIALISGRIVQKNEFRQIAGRLQGCFQTDQLPLEHLFIVVIAALLFKKPTPGTADGIAVAFVVIIVKDPLVSKSVLLAELIKLTRSAPPIVVIAL